MAGTTTAKPNGNAPDQPIRLEMTRSEYDLTVYSLSIAGGILAQEAQRATRGNVLSPEQLAFNAHLALESKVLAWGSFLNTQNGFTAESPPGGTDRDQVMTAAR